MKKIEKGDKVTIEFEVSLVGNEMIYSKEGLCLDPNSPHIKILSVEKPAVDWSKVPNRALVLSRDLGQCLFVGLDPMYEGRIVICSSITKGVFSIEMKTATLIGEV